MTSPDYDTLFDAEIHAYLKTCASFAPEAGTATPSEARAVFDKMNLHFNLPIPKNVSTTDSKINGVPTRHYTCSNSPKAVVQYMHGGGFMVGDLESHHTICADICDQTGLDVVSVDYRLSPEHPHPAAYNDTLAVFDALHGNLPIILAGDSAGATLAASVAMVRREKVKALMLIYPWLDKPGEHASFRTHANAPILTAAGIVEFDKLRVGDQPQPSDPSYFPLLGDDFNNMPHTFISTAECDPLKDEGALFQQLVDYSGGTAEHIEEPGLMHGHLRARNVSSVAAAAFNRITFAIKALAE